MIRLNCVACGRTELVRDLAQELRNPHCTQCGQPMVQYRQPGSAPQVHPSA